MTTHVLVTEAGARLAVVSCALRQAAPGAAWSVISDTGHQPSGLTGAQLVQEAGYLYSGAAMPAPGPATVYAATGNLWVHGLLLLPA